MMQKAQPFHPEPAIFNHSLKLDHFIQTFIKTVMINFLITIPI